MIKFLELHTFTCIENFCEDIPQCDYSDNLWLVWL